MLSSVGCMLYMYIELLLQKSFSSLEVEFRRCDKQPLAMYLCYYASAAYVHLLVHSADLCKRIQTGCQTPLLCKSVVYIVL